VLILVTPLLGITTRSGVMAAVCGGLAFACMVAGAVIGQIGRAMQGRVI
jgi:hypothetical protein